MARVRVILSPRISGASRITQSGEVNSSATTCASGMNASEKNHRFWPGEVEGVAHDVEAEVARA
jgi:hypothetical protein